jgi:hypothetical protein
VPPTKKVAIQSLAAHFLSFVVYLVVHVASALQRLLVLTHRLLSCPFHNILFCRLIASIPVYLPPNSPFLRLHGIIILLLSMIYPLHQSNQTPLLRPFLFVVQCREKKSLAEALRRAKEKGSERDKSIVNRENASRKLEPAVERNYLRMMDLWHEYATMRSREDVR